MTLTFTDIFCGAGGSSIGLAAAGFDLKLAANHWDRAIETHAANFTAADHLCADVSNYDMRRLPSTDVLWASPECTWHSPAGGRKKLRAQLDLLDDYVPNDGGIRSRATMYDVIRAAEAHRYKAVVVENVVEVADWPMFDWWMAGMTGPQLDYEAQIVCVSSAHIGGAGNPHAPQWRDRLYVVFTRRGIRKPNVDPRPPAWCDVCGEVVLARQSWKRTDRRRIGKYGQQYLYRCPRVKCRHQVVEPFVLPAAAAIDWSDVGERIGDRAKPLAANTIRRIRAGLDMFSQPTFLAVGGNTWEAPGSGYVRAWPALDSPLFARTGTPGDGIATPFGFNVNHGDKDGRSEGRPFPLDGDALPSRTTKIGDGIVTPAFLHVARNNNLPRPVDEPMPPLTTGHSSDLVSLPFIAELRGGGSCVRGVDDPLATITAGGNHHGLIQPGFYVKNYGGNCKPKHTVKGLGHPLAAITTIDHHALVVPYRRGKAKTTGEPFHTFGTRDSAGLASMAVEVEDCHFRMLKPREHLRGQRFPDSYIVTGNKGEQTMQAGNAVSSNVAQWIGAALAEVLA